MARPTRRTFAKSAVSAAALTAASYSRVFGANDRVALGFIGVGNRGDQLLDAFLPHKDVIPFAVCDIYDPYRSAAVDKISKALGSVNGKPCIQLKEYRKLLDFKALDAVVIATPDHWHALMFVD